MEDLLAFYLVSRLSSIEEAFINPTLIASGQPRFKPDLVLCRHSKIGAMLDVKLDLGWKRDKFGSTLRETDERMEKLHGQECSFLVKDASERKRERLRVSQSAKYFFVVLSDQNITSALCGSFEKCASALH
jgi:hypothetical protein